MKKLVLLLSLLILGILCAFSLETLEFSFSENEIEVPNFDTRGKPICKDNVRFINKTSMSLTFEVYGKLKSDSPKEFVCNVSVKPNSSEGESGKKALKKYKYIYVKNPYEEIKISEVTCEHNDMYFYIYPINNVTQEEDADFSKYQKVVKYEGISKDSIYEGILQGCVKVFNKSTYVIEYKNKETGVIKGKAQYTPAWVFSPTTYYFVFTFEAKDGRYRATFDNLEYDIGTAHVQRKGYGENEFNEMRPLFDNTINSINECIESSDSDDW